MCRIRRFRPDTPGQAAGGAADPYRWGVPSSPPPRSLADELRARDDEALADLLQLRPDLATPVPTDLGGLAVAAASRLSVQRAVDGLDAATLQVLEVLAVLPEPVSAARVGKVWGGNARDQLDRLRALALVWGGPRALRLVRAARDCLGPYPAGLGPPLADALSRRSPRRLEEVVEDLGLPPAPDPDRALAQLAAHLGDPDQLAKLLAGAPPDARTVLDRLAWGPPVGQLEDADRPVRAGSAGSPIEWLLAHGLLAVPDPGHVVLPREVGLALRGGHVHRVRETAPPVIETRAQDDARVAAASSQAAAEANRLVGELATLWATSPPAVLRSGGIGVRDLRRAAGALEIDESTAALVAELARAAGLIADDGEADPAWLPTPDLDTWRLEDDGTRWVRLAASWLESTRAPGLIGTRGPKDVLVAPLGPDVERPAASVVRRQVLGALADAGGAPTDPLGSSVLARLDWSAPRRAGRARADLVAWTLREAEFLGVTGLGALAPAGRALLADDAATAADEVDGALPAAVDHVLLQADLTAVAPGRLEAAMEQELALMADVESRGGATVYRFGPGSVRRALDAGRTGDELAGWLQQHSRTPVPQPLTYLITDSARRYGRLRVGMASSYLRGEDEATLTELVADRRAAGLRLRRLAPTVLAAQATPDVVLSTLRQMGLSPAAEGPEGDVVVRRPDARRASGGLRDRTPRRTVPLAPSRADLLGAIRAVRAVDANARRRPTPVEIDGGPPLEPMDPGGALAVIRDAVARRQDLWIGYLEGAGRPVRQIVEPLSVEAGRVRALERSSGQVRSYSVHRVIGVAPVE
jgi:hypothetical protein